MATRPTPRLARSCADPADPNAPTEVVASDIHSDTTWTCDRLWQLAPDTHVFVNGATLTIEPGTII